MMKLTGNTSFVCIIQVIRIELCSMFYELRSMFYKDHTLGHEQPGFTYALTAFDESSKVWSPEFFF